ncbi:MAG: NAD(P)H-dependent oxidoreductase, partial [Ferruginibacter sp.]|nr:NAD(P)H-dependent oxidoreductase [Ferruginibacter sp.]
MKNNAHFVAISGSLRRESYNTKVLKSLQNISPANIVIEQISIAEVPMYNFDLHDKVPTESVEKISTAIKTADALIIVTPEYN